ncbi:hypothetical protein HYW21_08190 [Candidatus Woesearchaeota archaeon]|nr:hypothetical protein [Candidatus Woesearchaeota archaeon]
MQTQEDISYGSKSPDNKRTIITIVVALLLILLVGWASYAFITARGQAALTGEVVRNNGEGQEKASDNKESTLGELDAQTASTGNISKESLIGVSGSLSMASYKIPLLDKDIQILAEQISLENPQVDLQYTINDRMMLKGFTGDLIWSGSQIFLKGEVRETSSQGLNINWKNTKDITIRIGDGTMLIDKVRLAELQGIASGELMFNAKMKLSLENEEVTIKGYEGNLESKVAANKNTLQLSGKVQSFTSATNSFTVDVS